MKRWFNKGDIVLCTKFSVEQNMVIDERGIKVVPCVDNTWFNRKAYVSKVYKEYMEQILGGTHEDKDEYEITFLDDGNSLAWVEGEDLVLLMRNDYKQGRKDSQNKSNDSKEMLEKIIHFFEMEIENCQRRLLEPSACFNGVDLGVKVTDELNEAHIRYCHGIINRIRGERI